MQNAYDTIFLPFLSDALVQPEPKDSVLFINAAPCKYLDLLQQSDLDLQQYFKPYAAALAAQNLAVTIEFQEKSYDLVLLVAPKNKLEAQYLIAKSAAALDEGGTLLCAADNDAGGKRLKAWLSELGFADIQEESKKKARVVWASKTQKLNTQGWIKRGDRQRILDGEYVSQPGVFGWDKIDQGSALLTQHLPTDLQGTGADFGCGYGYLSHQLLQHHTQIETLYVIDADARAVKAAEGNLQDFSAQKVFLWEDLSKPLKTPKNTLDWVVMNPPFHEGKNTDISLGQSFIHTAHHALKNDGILYMVANAHLPYEGILKTSFKDVQAMIEANGFKVFAAQKSAI